MIGNRAANSESFVVTTPSEVEIRMTRLFDAPRQLVFEAMTGRARQVSGGAAWAHVLPRASARRDRTMSMGLLWRAANVASRGVLRARRALSEIRQPRWSSR